MDAYMLNGITEDEDEDEDEYEYDGDDTDSSVSSSCDDTDSSVSGGCDDGASMRLVFDWTDDDLDDEYFYNYDND